MNRRPEAERGAIDPLMLEMLVCPLTKARLVYDRKNGELVSEGARLAYPIREGVPIMLVSEARHLEDRPAPTHRSGY
ncbi:Trm112 family protein [Pararhizobium mangrovi]|uniref:UPF0434 protein FJU11_10920 n=1 Tax=Pararhizobium mangrovi TaxID=2590452 RepID=A0A506U1V1_9HYPH|nr:Trm112 family protein [Pararhizobium mangrovi]TPW27740.1 Trm112 family protein [Pararhizobium mangrovi]